jgi:hypothetical protein
MGLTVFAEYFRCANKKMTTELNVKQTIMGLKIIAFCDIALSSLVGVHQCLRGAYCLHHQRISLIMGLVVG